MVGKVQKNSIDFSKLKSELENTRDDGKIIAPLLKTGVLSVVGHVAKLFATNAEKKSPAKMTDAEDSVCNKAYASMTLGLLLLDCVKSNGDSKDAVRKFINNCDGFENKYDAFRRAIGQIRYIDDNRENKHTDSLRKSSLEAFIQEKFTVLDFSSSTDIEKLEICSDVLKEISLEIERVNEVLKNEEPGVVAKALMAYHRAKNVSEDPMNKYYDSASRSAASGGQAVSAQTKSPSEQLVERVNLILSWPKKTNSDPFYQSEKLVIDGICESDFFNSTHFTDELKCKVAKKIANTMYKLDLDKGKILDNRNPNAFIRYIELDLASHHYNNICSSAKDVKSWQEYALSSTLYDACREEMDYILDAYGNFHSIPQDVKLNAYKNPIFADFLFPVEPRLLVDNTDAPGKSEDSEIIDWHLKYVQLELQKLKNLKESAGKDPRKLQLIASKLKNINIIITELEKNINAKDLRPKVKSKL